MYKAVVWFDSHFSWATYQHHARKLSHFYLMCFQRTLNIKWQDKVLEQTQMTNILTVLKQNQLEWPCHQNVGWLSVTWSISSMENLLQVPSCMVNEINDSRTHWRQLWRILTLTMPAGKLSIKTEMSGETMLKKKNTRMWNNNQGCSKQERYEKAMM